MGRRLTLGIGDNREHCFYIPVSFQLMRQYINEGFEMEELVSVGSGIPNHLIIFWLPSLDRKTSTLLLCIWSRNLSLRPIRLFGVHSRVFGHFPKGTPGEDRCNVPRQQ